MSPVIFEPIGLIHTPFKDPRKAPIQPRYAEGATGTVEVFAQYEEGLADLAGFSHIILLYHLHLSNGYSLKVVPYL
ncbi:MAG: TrmO family methyltransferase, partial [candidate division Zixibacteria bacterium]|nr:TrmO family methyltransferase [candidate division Zixibacteria bacterium]